MVLAAALRGDQGPLRVGIHARAGGHGLRPGVLLRLPADLNVCSREAPPLQPPALPPAPPVSPLPRYAIFAEPPLQYMHGVRDCEPRGGLMAAPLGVAANAELAAMLRARDLSETHMYIGVTDRNGKSKEGTFVLESTGEPIDASWPDGLPWASEPNQQPNNLRPNQGGQDCLVLDVNGTWGDAFCSDRLPYACEFLPSPPPAPPAAPPLQCPTSMTQLWACDLPGYAGHEWCRCTARAATRGAPFNHPPTLERRRLPCAPRRACNSLVRTTAKVAAFYAWSEHRHWLGWRAPRRRHHASR